MALFLTFVNLFYECHIVVLLTLCEMCIYLIIFQQKPTSTNSFLNVHHTSARMKYHDATSEIGFHCDNVKYVLQQWWKFFSTFVACAIYGQFYCIIISLEIIPFVIQILHLQHCNNQTISLQLVFVVRL